MSTCPLSKVNGRNIDATECRIEFPNDKSLRLLMGRLRAIAQKRRKTDIIEEFPITPLPIIAYHSKEYLSMWPSTHRENEGGEKRKMIRTFRVDSRDGKYIYILYCIFKLTLIFSP
jgi:hypothetical protein